MLTTFETSRSIFLFIPTDTTVFIKSRSFLSSFGKYRSSIAPPNQILITTTFHPKFQTLFFLDIIHRNATQCGQLSTITHLIYIVDSFTCISRLETRLSSKQQYLSIPHSTSIVRATQPIIINDIRFINTVFPTKVTGIVRHIRNGITQRYTSTFHLLVCLYGSIQAIRISHLNKCIIAFLGRIKKSPTSVRIDLSRLIKCKHISAPMHIYPNHVTHNTSSIIGIVDIVTFK